MSAIEPVPAIRAPSQLSGKRFAAATVNELAPVAAGDMSDVLLICSSVDVPSTNARRAPRYGFKLPPAPTAASKPNPVAATLYLYCRYFGAAAGALAGSVAGLVFFVFVFVVFDFFFGAVVSAAGV
jgi:hypothetical protein